MEMGVKDHTKDFRIKPNNCGKHSDLFPSNIFCVVAGSTGSGKTNLLVDLLKSGSKLNYHDVYIYTTTLYQPAYEHLKEYYGNMEKMIKYQTGQTVKIAHFLDPDEELVAFCNLAWTKKHGFVVINLWDDAYCGRYWLNYTDVYIPNKYSK